MPLIGPAVAAALRRHWTVVAALLVFVLFTLANLAWVQPLERRYQALVARATQLGMAVGPERTPRTLSPALMALFMSNSMEAGAAQQQATSGQLTTTLLEDMTRAAARNGLEVVVAEQGSTTQQQDAVQVRGHLRLRGGYGALVGMIAELARSGRLYSIERFTIAERGEPRPVIELWMSRYILKLSSGAARS